MNYLQKVYSLNFLAMGVLIAMAPMQGSWARGGPPSGPTPPALGAASSFAVLGSSAVTCDSIGASGAPSSVVGAVGSLTAVTGLPPASPILCALAGTVHMNDDDATSAIRDFHLAYAALRDRKDLACPRSDATHNIDGDLIGLTLTPGVYCIGSASPALLSGQLILDGLGDQNAVWIFKSATGITPIGGSVVVAGKGTACNVYWQAGTLVSLDNTDFLGNILAGTAVTFTGVGSSLVGRAFGDTGVTMTGGATVSSDGCGGAPGKPHT